MEKKTDKTLIVITGPTASGKTDLSLALANRLSIPVISADSRQIYRDIPIGTAAPTPQQMLNVPHYFIGTKSLDEYFSAWQFETEALQIINHQFLYHDYALMCGGSMMYIDAVVKGLDEIPTISPEIRESVYRQYEENGLDHMLHQLETMDPEYFNIVDKRNHKRVLHAIEIIRQSGTTYTQLRTNTNKQRDFKIVEIALELPRDLLFERIGLRVDKMIELGLEEEAERVYSLKHLNSLNTVGFKELFAWKDGAMSREEAIEKIKRNTRVFAKKQITWLKKNPSVIYIYATQPIETQLNNVLNIIGTHV